ncbi:LOW QUALITY PROTEIN: cytoplasmic tRNA 2-thiolation protein 2 [Hippoglossus hippoglossus]|uniref:LOW QUALITY PROTEIN: cytoplasmic tRNA 2-thiolation protein 2 n=1 Tax=Hippoglossus hippoglossus TaxID=8267 RepID=UPI00148E3DB1|nr:LOW QUALITY PROTEIN: cytoplasmic tRNA 2-thiolation protein 2 [Hippoglossus hippoglossus]
MCQVDEDYHDGLDRAEVPSVFKKCVKCKEASAAVVIRAGDTFCRGCFKEYFIHKFRAMLGKNRIIFPGDKVLLAVSGGSSSCSMLSQVLEGLSQNAHKKLRFLPGIVYIDEGGVVGQSVDERLRTVAELQAVFRATGFPFYVVPLEQVLDLPSSVVVMAPSLSEQPASAYKEAVDQFLKSNSGSCLNPKDQDPTSLRVVPEAHTQLLQQLIVSAKTLTARHDLLNTLRQHLLVHTARTEGYRKVMLGDNCTRLAIKILTSISLGRGAQLAQDTGGFSDSRYGDIILVRPMRDYFSQRNRFTTTICSTWASVFIPSLDTKTTEKASIQRLTESFVTKLQVDFPSTVSTIYRTSEKLQTACKSSSTADRSDRCLLCVCALDTSVENASSFQATLTSEQLSQTKYPARNKSDRLHPAAVELESSVPSGPCCSSGGGEDCGGAESGEGCCSAKEPEKTNLKTLLCYSCHLTIKDMSSVEHLPQYILLEAQRRKRRSKMREEISEFLLDDGEGGH